MVLVPMKDDEGFTSGQPLCFNLKATLITKIIVKKMNISSNLYEVIPLNIDIDLPISSNQADFTISLIE